MLKAFLSFFLVVVASGCNNNPVSPASAGKGSITGTITAKYFYPVRGISGSLVIAISPSTSDSVLTDGSGNFQFPGLHAGRYSINITASMYYTVDTTIEVVGDKASALAIETPLTYRYESGTVLVGFKDSTTVESAFELFSGLGLTVKSLKGFNYRSNLPTDSLSFVRRVLESKTYLTETDYTVFVADGFITVLGFFNNLDSAKVADWEQAKAQLQLVSVPYSYQDGNIQTEPGQEIVWVKSLNKYPMVKWLELNYYALKRFSTNHAGNKSYRSVR